MTPLRKHIADLQPWALQQLGLCTQQAGGEQLHSCLWKWTIQKFRNSQRKKRQNVAKRCRMAACVCPYRQRSCCSRLCISQRCGNGSCIRHAMLAGMHLGMRWFVQEIASFCGHLCGCLKLLVGVSRVCACGSPGSSWAVCSFCKSLPLVAMMSPRLVLLLLAFISACLLPRTWADEAGAVIDEEDEYVDAEVPQPALLVAYKNVKTPKIVQGCNVTMSISLFNVGTGYVIFVWTSPSPWPYGRHASVCCRTANDISVEDTLPPNFSLIEGSLKASFKYLDPGATVSMEYIGIPSVGDQKLLAKPAKVVYKTGKDKAHHLLSTSPFMEILSTRQNVELHLVKVVRSACIFQPSDRTAGSIAGYVPFIWLLSIASRVMCFERRCPASLFQLFPIPIFCHRRDFCFWAET